MAQTVIELDAELYSDNLEFDSEATSPETLLMEGDVGILHEVSSNNYRKLINKPTINGTELYDNYDEIDPTVPSWAKEETKPEYTAEEVGAIDEDASISLTDIKSIWDSVFNRGG